MKRPLHGAVGTIAAAALVAAAAISCPNPIDEDLLLVVDDAIAPTLVVTAPTANSYYHGTMTVTGTLADSSSEAGDGRGRLASLSFSVSDSSPLTRTVTFDADGNAVVTPADPTFSWNQGTGEYSFQLPTDGMDGYKVLTFVATDVNDNAARLDVTVLPYPFGPNLALDEPVNFSTYDLVVTIGGTVTDTSSDATTDEVKAIRWTTSAGMTRSLAIDPGTWNPSTGRYESGTFAFDPATGAFSDWFDSSALKNPILLEVSAENATASSSRTVQVFYNGTGPAITLAPAAAGHNPCEYSSAVTIAITVDGTVDVSNLKPGSVTYWVKQAVGTPKTGSLVPDPATGAFSFTFNPKAVPVLSGNLTIEVKAKDNRDIESSASYACYDDPIPPAAPVVSGPASPTNDTTPTWTWTTPADTVEFRHSLTSTTGPWTTTTDTSYSPTLGAGSHTLWVQGRDAVGNWSSSDSASVTIDLTPPSAPNVTGPTPTPTNNTTPTWTWTTPAGTVEFRYSLSSATGPWSTTTDTFYTPTLAEGSYTLWVQGRDAAGNWSSSDSASVDIDLTPPDAPTFTAPTTPTDDTTPTWRWTTPADATGFRRSLDGGAWQPTGSPFWTVSPPFSAGETHTLDVQARDAAGNWSTSGSYTIEIVP